MFEWLKKIWPRKPEPAPDPLFALNGYQSLRNVHKETPDCTKFGCPIHGPSDHSMAKFPLWWRDDRGLMERLCPHGVGHPDPDHIGYTRRLLGAEAARVESLHGCDGCCH